MYFFSCNSWWSCGHKHMLTTRLNWKVKSMETSIWKIESEVISSFSNVWHTQHQKQDNRPKKTITGTCFVFEPHWSVHLSMTKLAMNDEGTKLYKSMCKCHHRHHRQEQKHIFFGILVGGFIVHLQNISDGLPINIKYEHNNQSGVRSWSQLVFHTWAWCGWVLEKGSPAKYNVHQHPAPATISHS